MNIKPIPVIINNLPIRLGQFLKLAELVQDGLEAKIMIQDNLVRVNGEIETRRGRQLVHGDQVQLADSLCTVISDQEKTSTTP